MKNRGMNFVDAPMPEITPGATSYFSAPSTELDPRLFEGNHLQSWVRSGITALLFDHLAINYSRPNTWAKVWLAGSGISYQWEAAREPGDLDCLIGIDYVNFRRFNTEYVALSDQEIASTFNERFNADLTPNTRNWEGYELTFYVNPQSDIRDINPYAAYDLINDSWTVEPEQNPQPPYSRAWEQRAERDRANSQELLNRYNSALNELRSATNPAYRINAERKLQLATDQIKSFYDDIHAGRKIAFSKVGAGYSDYNNYRWQAGKRSGAVQALRTITEHKKAVTLEEQKEKYGVELPDADTLLRRSIRGS